MLDAGRDRAEHGPTHPLTRITEAINTAIDPQEAKGQVEKRGGGGLGKVKDAAERRELGYYCNSVRNS